MLSPTTSRLLAAAKSTRAGAVVSSLRSEATALVLRHRQPTALKCFLLNPAVDHPLALQQWRGMHVKVTSTPAKASKEQESTEDEDDKFPQIDRAKEEEILKLQTHVRLAHKHGDYNVALESSQELLQVTQDHFGKDHPATATAYNNIGLMNKLLGNYAKSRKSYHEALRIYDRVVGKDHASYAAALHNLGNLNRSQVLLDDALTAMERLQFNEAATEYLQEAWDIRMVELGEHHPHTVASRSNLGSTIATQVLQQLSTSDQQSKLSRKQWEVAKLHLESSLQTAIDNPRGHQVRRNKKTKHRKPQPQLNVTTLSAASAAQNLAVFLKCKSTILSCKDKNAADNDELARAKQLYQASLVVRSELLHEGHPDLVATKHSLAELLTVLGDEDGANKLRNEILDAHDVQEIASDEKQKSK